MEEDHWASITTNWKEPYMYSSRVIEELCDDPHELSLQDLEPCLIREYDEFPRVFDRGGASGSVIIATPSQPTRSLYLGQHR